MYQPKTPAQYLELVDQAIFEVEDLLRCAEDEEGGIVEFASQMPVYQELLAELKAMNTAWEGAAPPHDPKRRGALPLVRLEEIYRAFSYINKWTAQLQERIVQLAF